MNTALITLRTSAIAAALLATGLATTLTMAADNRAATPAAFASDDAVTMNVKTAIVDAVGAKSPDITVTNRNGTILLGGWAHTDTDVRKATYAAKRVAGVKRVYANGVHLWSTRGDGL
jgi:osmotically-inducible protein OsmY